MPIVVEAPVSVGRLSPIACLIHNEILSFPVIEPVPILVAFIIPMGSEKFPAE